MNTNWKEILTKLKKDAEYRKLFIETYKILPTEKTVKDAIATFERSLITPNSPFDKYLKGDNKALSDKAKKGFDIFKDYGCASCHQGVNLGGNMFQTMGVMSNYFENKENITEKDLGRYNVTKLEEDKYVFRVPSLRNVELTAPYFHDGSAETLEDAISVMAKYQLGREFSKEETEALAAFLRSLTGEYNADAEK